MNTSMQDQAAGKFHETMGRLRVLAGKITDNPKLETEGLVEQISGTVQNKIGQIKKILRR
jgi:uncharacterized protein YjbJ (UPF0337 family)